MRHFLSGLMVVALGVPLRAQKIGTESLNRDRIVQVHTALNHLTVIEVGEPVVTVVAGSPAFKVEWRDNKVFVEDRSPLEVASEKLLVAKLNPGQETVGVVGIKLTRSSSEPRVLRIEFPKDGRGAVGAGLVL